MPQIERWRETGTICCPDLREASPIPIAAILPKRRFPQSPLDPPVAGGRMLGEEVANHV